MKRTWMVVLAVLLTSSVAFAQFDEGAGGGGEASKMNLKGGTMQLGGTVEFAIEMQMPDQGDSVTGFALNFMPAAGYFVADNFEIFGAVMFNMGFGDLYENAGKLAGFMAGAQYFLPMGSIIPHFGVGIGMSFNIPKEGDTTKGLNISAPIGLLYPLNSWVAIDLGLKIDYFMSLEDGGGSNLTIPIGYFGVQAFF